MRPLFLALLLLCTQHGLAHAADIYGYVDSKGVAHFAAEKIDERYQIFFRRGQSFDTSQGVAPFGRGGRKLDGKVPQASQTLLALFEASPSYKTAKTALRDASSKHSIDYELLQALIATESGFDAQAVSPKGAMGLMQLMPATAQRYGVAADVWSVTSYKTLRVKTLEAERWNLWHPDEPPRVSYLQKTVQRFDGPCVAVSDYVRLVSQQISPWIPGGLLALGTDGFGRSDSRKALRRYFEIDAEHLAVATLYALHQQGAKVTAQTVRQAAQDLGLAPDDQAPWQR